MATAAAEFRAAFEDTWHGLAAACDGLTEEEWERPTDLPGWSVKDNVSHVVGVELLMLGEPFPDHACPDLPHVRNDAGRWTEVPVDLRRSAPGAAVLAELRSVVARRLESLRAVRDEDLAGDAVFPYGSRVMALRHVLGIRVFDCWTHEQDVRRAVGRPGGLSGPAAHLSRRRMLLGLSQVDAGAAGRSVVVETTGALPSVATLTFGAPYAEGDRPDADARLTLDFETLVRLATGRVLSPGVAVSVDGDRELGERLLRSFAITP